MSDVRRIEVYPKNPSSLEGLVGPAKKYLKLNLEKIYKAKLYLAEYQGELNDSTLLGLAQNVFTDEITETCFTKDEHWETEYDHVIEVKFKPGVTDNPAHAALDAISIYDANLAKSLNVYTGSLFFIKGDVNQNDLKHLASELLGNDLLNTFKFYQRDAFNKQRFASNDIPVVKMHTKEVQTIDLSQSLQNLKKLSDVNCWALTEAELEQIQKYYAKPEVQTRRSELGLPSMPTDVEMEVIAQSWSEHCKHKIFASNIHYSESDKATNTIGSKTVKSLYKSYIKKATEDIKQKRKLDWLISVFTDNAGIVRFDSKLDLCIKVETHNSPSALDPYGGALTGILGVNRDILGCGIGAKPVANTDVFCFAHESMVENGIELPSGLKHPKRILEGVHLGVEDGGNKSGIPTVNGSIYYDDDYAGKPLVYVGTVGVMPQQTNKYASSSQKEQKPGDLVVMVGGRIGADGIHGATFSSLELDENSPATAVQIGDPLTQKKVMDFLIAARNEGLYSSVTDNGAGGLSSSVGEMAELAGGVTLDLKKAPVKYPGLSPFELMISESQERMTFAVPVEKIDAFLNLSKRYKVESTVLGEFMDTGHLTVTYGDKIVADLNMHFLHDSLIPMELPAEFSGPQNPYAKAPWHGKKAKLAPSTVTENLKTMLARPNIASKEDLVRRYDHEVQAATVVKPFTGKHSGPSDAGVIWLAPHGGDEKNAIAISNGLQPLTSHLDAYVMAQQSVDEAVRNAVATGADPDQMVLLDNFCWPDPVEGPNNPDAKHKMAQLVRTCQALYDVTTTYGMPFVSGKDSMKNDYRGKDAKGNPVKISVPPTVLITCMGRIPDVEKVLTSEFKQVGDLVYHLGNFPEKLDFSEFTRTFKLDNLDESFSAAFNAKENLALYRQIFSAASKNLLVSCHDISEGGLAVTLAESCFGEKFGLNVKIPDNLDLDTALFAEGNGRFVVSVKAENKTAFEKHFPNAIHLGSITDNNQLVIQHKTTTHNCNVSELMTAWRGRAN